MNIGYFDSCYSCAFAVIERDVGVVCSVIATEGELVTLVLQTISVNTLHASTSSHVSLPFGHLAVLHQVQVDVLALDVGTG